MRRPHLPPTSAKEIAVSNNKHNPQQTKHLHSPKRITPMDYKALLEKALQTHVGTLRLLYHKDGLCLAEADGKLVLCVGNIAYTITSSPQEPCTYLQKAGCLIAAIHNAFNASEIIGLAETGKKLHTISGNYYDLGSICQMLAYACEKVTDCSIDYLEGLVAMEKMKKMGATSPETAVYVSNLGIKQFSACFTHSKKWRKVLCQTPNGKYYLKLSGDVH